MDKAYVFFTDGLEEVEALTPVDMLRRAGVLVTTVSMTGERTVTGDHHVKLAADCLFQDCDFRDGDLFILPGGPGHIFLKGSYDLKKLLQEKNAEGKHIAAICASPSVLAAFGIVGKRKAVVYPGMESLMGQADMQDLPVVTDGNLTTGHGPGAAFDFAFELVRIAKGEQAMLDLKKQTVWQH